MSKGFLIYFLGPEGSGKTTHIKLLTKWLNRQGYRVKSPVYVRSDHIFLYILKRALIAIGRYEVVTYPDGAKKVVPQREVITKMRRFWVLAQIPMAILAMLFKVYIPLALGTIVIAERYLLDTFIDIINMLKIFGLEYKGFIKQCMRILLYLVPKNIIIIQLHAPYRVLVTRYKLRNTPVEPEQWVTMQKRLSDVFIKVYRGVSIDTSKSSLPRTQATIRSIIAKFIGKESGE